MQIIFEKKDLRTWSLCNITWIWTWTQRLNLGLDRFFIKSTFLHKVVIWKKILYFVLSLSPTQEKRITPKISKSVIDTIGKICQVLVNFTFNFLWMDFCKIFGTSAAILLNSTVICFFFDFRRYAIVSDKYDVITQLHVPFDLNICEGFKYELLAIRLHGRMLLTSQLFF